MVALLVCSYALAARLEFEVGSTLAIATDCSRRDAVPVATRATAACGRRRQPTRRAARLRPPACAARAVLIVVGSSWLRSGRRSSDVSSATLSPTCAPCSCSRRARCAVRNRPRQLVVREWSALRVPPRQFVSQLALVFTIDLVLAPVGLLAALAAVHDALALLLPLPLLAAVGLSTRERRRRMRPGARALERLPRHRVPARRRRRGRRRVHRSTQPRRLELVLAVCDEMSVDPRARRTPSSPHSSTTSARSTSQRRSSTSRARSTAEERAIIDRHTIEGEHMLAAGRRTARRSRADRPLLPRALGRRRLPGRARRRGDPARRPDRLRLRRVQRDDDRPELPSGPQPREALAEIAACAGSHFDPAVAGALVKVIGRRPEAQAVSGELVPLPAFAA